MSVYRTNGPLVRNKSPNWALGLGKFEPHDFHAKNIRINRFKQMAAMVSENPLFSLFPIEKPKLPNLTLP